MWGWGDAREGLTLKWRKWELVFRGERELFAAREILTLNLRKWELDFRAEMGVRWRGCGC